MCNKTIDFQCKKLRFFDGFLKTAKRFCPNRSVHFCLLSIEKIDVFVGDSDLVIYIPVSDISQPSGPKNERHYFWRDILNKKGTLVTHGSFRPFSNYAFSPPGEIYISCVGSKSREGVFPPPPPRKSNPARVRPNGEPGSGYGSDPMATPGSGYGSPDGR